MHVYRYKMLITKTIDSKYHLEKLELSLTKKIDNKKFQYWKYLSGQTEMGYLGFWGDSLEH